MRLARVEKIPTPAVQALPGARHSDRSAEEVLLKIALGLRLG
jgi:hypothetical protein